VFDSSTFLVSLPAGIALLCKIGIFVYARSSNVVNAVTRLYLLFLFALSLQNVAEIFHFYTIARGGIPYLEFTVYYAAITAALALLVHISLRLSFPNHARRASIPVYAYAAVIEALLLLTPWIIAGLTPMGHTATRIAGPLYFLFELYAVGCFLGVIGILAWGAYRQSSALQRAKARLFLLAIVPMAGVIVTVLVMLRLGIRLTNATVVYPLAITYFLIVTAYATYQHRLFDISFYIPWSKVRQRKTAFYDRIRSMIAEIADLSSVAQVVNRLADTLRCPVVLVGGPQPTFATTDGALRMLGFPSDELRKIDHIVIANEIAAVAPATHALMKQYGVAAVVPFYPRSHAASWMLLGDSFNEQVYTPLDFRMVERLFDHLSEQFLDKLVLLRSQLHEARDQLQTLQYRLEQTSTELTKLQEQNTLLREYNFRLLRERAVNRSDVANKDGAHKPVRLLKAEPQAATENELPLAEHVSQFEARLIVQALERCGGNKSQAARMLGLRPNTLHYKIERYGLADKGGSENENPE
jgi:hypothetical protein